MRLGLAAALLVGLLAHAAAAASLSAGDLLVLGRVLAFVQPPPAGSIVIAYASGDAASRADAEAIAGLIGDGIRFGGGVLRPKLVAAAAGLQFATAFRMMSREL